MQRRPLLAALLLAVAVGWLPGQARGQRLSPTKRRGPDTSWVLELNDGNKAQLDKRTVRRAIRDHGLKRVALSNDFLRRHNTRYKVQIPRARQPHTVHDQKSSSRCWAFASDRVLETRLACRGVDSSKLSEAFVTYHAMKDRACAVLDLGAEKGKYPNSSEIYEGGSFPWATSVVSKHGMVPGSKMRSTADGDSSGVYLSQLKTLVASAQRQMRRAGDGPDAEAQRKSIARQYKKQVTRLLDTTVGKPPRSFKVNGKRYTPKSYAREVLGETDYVVLENNPTRAWNRRYKVDMSPLVYERYNVGMGTLQQAVKKTIQSGEAVYVSTNVSKSNPHRVDVGEQTPTRAKGVLSIKALKYDRYAPTGRLRKYDRLRAKINRSNHGMVITGYDPGRGKRVRKWQIENSWGPASGDKGHLHMYDDYFREYVEKVAVPRSAVDPKVLERADRGKLLD
jgi:bleomycin hydrolase